MRGPRRGRVRDVARRPARRGRSDDRRVARGAAAIVRATAHRRRDRDRARGQAAARDARRGPVQAGRAPAICSLSTARPAPCSCIRRRPRSSGFARERVLPELNERFAHRTSVSDRRRGFCRHRSHSRRRTLQRFSQRVNDLGQLAGTHIAAFRAPCGTSVRAAGGGCGGVGSRYRGPDHDRSGRLRPADLGVRTSGCQDQPAAGEQVMVFAAGRTTTRTRGTSDSDGVYQIDLEPATTRCARTAARRSACRRRQHSLRLDQRSRRRPLADRRSVTRPRPGRTSAGDCGRSRPTGNRRGAARRSDIRDAARCCHQPPDTTYGPRMRTTAPCSRPESSQPSSRT